MVMRVTGSILRSYGGSGPPYRYMKTLCCSTARHAKNTINVSVHT